MRELLLYAQKENIGTATVYRYLERLQSLGKLSKFSTENSDGTMHVHWCKKACASYHFICNTCGECYHVDCPELSAMHSHITNHHGFDVDFGQTVFRGKCASCAGKETK